MNTLKNIRDIIEKISELNLSTDKSIIIAIDGRCASGKTTLAKTLKNTLNCNLFHADDYFLLPEQRTAERLRIPGGNFDIERFYNEIILGLKSGNNFSYSPFNCSTMSLSEPVYVTKAKINIIEGSYSCHPDIINNYDLTIFVTTDKKIQKERILQRNKLNSEMFFSKWIPLEENYFNHFDIENKCDYVFYT